MRKLPLAINLASVLVAVGLGAYLASPVLAQCNGVFPSNTICGNLSGSPKPPAAFTAGISIFGPGSSTVSAFAIWGNTSGTQLANPPQAEPSLVHTAPIGAMLPGSGNNFVFGNSAALSNTPGWMQVRSALFDGNSGPILIQPFGGAVTIYSSQNVGGNSAIQINHNFTSTATYAPPGGPTPAAALTAYNVADNGQRAFGGGGVQVFATDIGASVGQSTQGFSSYCFGENAANAGCWPLYMEGHKMTSPDYAYGTEIAMVNRSGFIAELNPNNTPPAVGGSTGVQLDCGNGDASSFYLQYGCSVGILFVNNNGPGQVNAGGFQHGITFREISVASSPYNPPDAIAFSSATSQAISWWSNATSRGWVVYSNLLAAPAAGPNTLVLSNSAIFSTPVSTSTLNTGAMSASSVTAPAYTAGTSPGVSCAAGTTSAATMVVNNGIVTHC